MHNPTTHREKAAGRFEILPVTLKAPDSRADSMASSRPAVARTAFLLPPVMGWDGACTTTGAPSPRARPPPRRQNRKTADACVSGALKCEPSRRTAACDGATKACSHVPGQDCHRLWTLRGRQRNAEAQYEVLTTLMGQTCGHSEAYSAVGICQTWTCQPQW